MFELIIVATPFFTVVAALVVPGPIARWVKNLPGT